MRVDVYELLGPLGAGGMGEVYKARDTHLGRLVALKVLSSQLTADRDASARLDREARTLASVSHPHVCALFGLAEHENRSVLVMEYLEGITLAQRLVKGRLAITECLRIAVEIAAGLAAAHRAGIIHRDLKPENIMLTKPGVKLLDFGLAKPEIAAVHGSVADTMTGHQLTREGTIAGTLPYMAPEQLERREADARTDIWAFGCVLFEMVTGRKAFEGPTAASLIGVILERDAPAASALEPAASGALDRVIRKCLAKDPEERWQTVQDLGDELKWLGGGTSAVPSPIRSRTRSWRAGLAGAIAGLALASTALLISGPWRSPAADATPTHLELTIPRLALVDSVMLSPDGRQLAFIAPDRQGRNMLWVRSLAENLAQPLAGTEGAHPGTPPFWSPDGRTLAFVSDNKLKRIELAGGSPVTLTDITGEVMGGSWSPRGSIVIGTQQASKTHGVHTLAAAGGPLVPLIPLEPGALLHGSPKFLPDGKQFLYLSWAFDENRRELCVASLDRPTGRCLGIKLHYFAGFTSDFIVYGRGDTLFVHPFDLAAGQPTGEPSVIAEGLAHDPFGRMTLSIAGTNTLVYQSAPREMRQFVWADRGGRPAGVVGEAGGYGGFDVTGRGDYILAEREEGGDIGLWLIDVARGVTSPAVVLPAGANRDRLLGPVLTRDGDRFFYRTRRSGHALVVEQPTRGGGERVVYEYRGGGVLYLADVSADLQWVAIGIAEPGRRYAALIPRRGGDPVTFAEGQIDLASSRLSPDGRWVAYVSYESGRAEVYVTPLPPSGKHWQVSTAGGVQPAWGGDGEELFYLAPDGSLMAVPVGKSVTFDAGTPTRLFSTTALADRFRVAGYRVTADGRRFLLNTLRPGDKAATTTTLQVVLNWTAAVKR
jgi:serine/threonine protein kinase/Tol biopolymer transport system component